MRTIHYYVIHKETNKVVFSHWDSRKCRDFLSETEDREDYCLGYKWVSI